MSDTPETIAAIIQSVRYRADNYRHDGWESVAEELEDLADRIEAAAERERDEDRQLAAIAESDESFARCARCDRPERATGNAAAMREALKAVFEKLLECAPTAEQEWPELVEMARAALERKPEENSGNAAAMRAALEDVLEKIDAWRTDGTMEHWQYSQLFDTCDAALAAPARNCDRYDVEDGVAACMQAIDAAWHEIDTIRATIGWMFAPAEGGDHA